MPCKLNTDTGLRGESMLEMYGDSITVEGLESKLESGVSAILRLGYKNGDDGKPLYLVAHATLWEANTDEVKKSGLQFTAPAEVEDSLAGPMDADDLKMVMGDMAVIVEPHELFQAYFDEEIGECLLDHLTRCLAHTCECTAKVLGDEEGSTLKVSFIKKGSTYKVFEFEFKFDHDATDVFFERP